MRKIGTHNLEQEVCNDFLTIKTRINEIIKTSEWFKKQAFYNENLFEELTDIATNMFLKREQLKKELKLSLKQQFPEGKRIVLILEKREAEIYG